MIILDTNQLEYAQPPAGALLTMLKTVAMHTGNELCLPDMALLEHQAHFRHEVVTAQAELVRAVTNMRRLVPWWSGREVLPFEVDAAVRTRTEALQQIFRIVPTPQWANAEAMMREAKRLPPASPHWDKPGAGARDVAIWLTAVQAASEEAGDIYFVSQDKAAFGAAALRTELVLDLSERHVDVARFHYCYGVDALFDEIAVKHGPPPTAKELAASEEVRHAVANALIGSQVFFELADAVGTSSVSSFTSSSSGISDLTLIDARPHVVAYEVGDRVFASARARWRAFRDLEVHYLQTPAAETRLVRVTFAVNTTIVMELDVGGQIITAEVSSRDRLADLDGRVLS